MLRPYTAQGPCIAYHDIRVARHRLPEDRAVAVAGTLRAGARRRLEIVDEPLYDAPFHEARGARRHTLIVQRTGRGSADQQRIVGEREAAVEHLLAAAPGEGRDALQHGLA